MSMQIGPISVGPVTQQEIRHVAQRLSEPRAVDLSAFLPWERESGDIKAMAEELERISHTFNKKLKYVVDHESNEVLVKVIDTETDKVIKILPPEELQRLHRRIEETLGFLFDQMV